VLVPGEFAEFDFAVAVDVDLLKDSASKFRQLVVARLSLQHHPHSSTTRRRVNSTAGRHAGTPAQTDMAQLSDHNQT